ncbi:hypothetical protein ES702_00281 [subsurface metagenome]
MKTASNTERFQERYKLHQYWARKPWYIVKECIERFTKPGDIILDPFVGSGITACEALIARRRVIAIDLNPIATLITKVTCYSPVDLCLLRDTFESILGNVQGEISRLYGTNCSQCGHQATIINTIWRDSSPYLIFYSCKHCNRKDFKSLDNGDLSRIKQVEEFHGWYPSGVGLPSNADVSKLEQLFTRRNLEALSVLHNKIQQLDETPLKEVFWLMFSSMLARASKLIFVNNYRLTKKVNPAGVWGEKRFWIPEQYVENNVFYYFRERLPKFMKGKRESNILIGDYFEEGKTIKILTQSATDLSNVPSNSIDFCFTDPPYGGSIQYLDLSIIWNAWLQFTPDYAEEIIAKEGGIKQYQMMLNQAFKEIYRVLRPRKYLCVTFHSSDISVWNTLLIACKEAGFELVDLTPEPPLKRSHNQIELPGAVKSDILLTFKKPDAVEFTSPSVSSPPSIRNVVIEAARELLQRTNSALAAEIYDRTVIKWTQDVYYSQITEDRNELNLNSLTNILKSCPEFESFIELIADYKGRQRKVTKWCLIPQTNTPS